MNEQKIKVLLERYFEGETSLPEERTLRDFFLAENVPASLKPYVAMFAFYEEEKKAVCGSARKRTAGIRLWLPTGAAAAIALFFAVRALLPQQEAYIYYVDGERVYNREAVIAFADDKLQLFSASVQRAKNGMTALEKLNGAAHSLKQFDEIQQKIMYHKNKKSDKDEKD
ncbi:MAG: hypothetical protein LBR08_13135 [Bacteroidales bacterium]|jgi:hypothetical protein|nr:hypothetical protein [Bacteroidales bacterium]